jgi:hypothetical protein
MSCFGVPAVAEPDRYDLAVGEVMAASKHPKPLDRAAPAWVGAFQRVIETSATSP